MVAIQNKTIDRNNINTPSALAEGMDKFVTDLKAFNAVGHKDKNGRPVGISADAIKQLENADTSKEYQKAFTRIFVEQVQALVKLGKLPETFMDKQYQIPGSTDKVSLQQILKDGTISDREYKLLAFIPGSGQNYDSERAIVNKKGNYIVEQIELDIISASKGGKIGFSYTNDRGTCPDQTKFGILQLLPQLPMVAAPGMPFNPPIEEYIPKPITIKTAKPIPIDAPSVTEIAEFKRKLEDAGFYNRDRNQIVVPRGKENALYNLVWGFVGFGPKALEDCCKLFGCEFPSGLPGGGVGTGGGPGTGSF
jgi:hypothetical protein